MRSTVRLTTIFCVILTAFSFLGAAMVAMAIQLPSISFGMKFAAIIFLFSTALISMLLTISLRSMCRDMDIEYEANAIKLRDLSKKIAALEEKCK